MIQDLEQIEYLHDLEKDVGGGVVVGQVTHSVDHKRDAS